MKFDDILREIGEFGPYQKRIYILTCIPAIHVGCLILLNVVIFGVPDHRCKIPGLDNDTWDDHSPEHEALVKYYIPPSDDYPYDRCHLFDHKNTSVHENGSVPANSSEVKCHVWVYDTSVFQNTFTKQVNLVCDDALLISHAQTIYYFGVLVGSIVFGQLADIIGRKKSLYSCLMVMLVSSVSLTFAPEFYSFVVIYFFVGSASLSTLVSAFVLGMEYVGPSKRIWAGTIMAMIAGVGSLYYILMSYLLRDWQKIQLTVGIPCIIYVVFICIIPESPRWLLSNDKKEDAIAIITKMAKQNGKQLTTEMLSSLRSDESHRKGRFWQLFSTKTLAFRTVVLFINWFVVSMAFYGVILNVGNLGGDFYLNLFLLSAVEYPCKIIILGLLDRVGRKKVYIGFMLLGGIACVGTIYPVVEKGESLHWLLVTLSVLGKMFVSGAFEVLYILSTELFPTVVRNIGMGSSSACARAGSMLSPYIAQLADLVNSNIAGAIPLTIIGAAAFIGGLLSFTLPETLNKRLPDTIEEADQIDKYKDKEITVPVTRRMRSEYTQIE